MALMVYLICQNETDQERIKTSKNMYKNGVVMNDYGARVILSNIFNIQQNSIFSLTSAME